MRRPPASPEPPRGETSEGRLYSYCAVRVKGFPQIRGERLHKVCPVSLDFPGLGTVINVITVVVGALLTLPSLLTVRASASSSDARSAPRRSVPCQISAFRFLQNDEGSPRRAQRGQDEA